MALGRDLMGGREDPVGLWGRAFQAEAGTRAKAHPFLSLVSASAELAPPHWPVLSPPPPPAHLCLYSSCTGNLGFQEERDGRFPDHRGTPFVLTFALRLCLALLAQRSRLFSRN